MSDLLVRRARHKARCGRHHWLVYDYRGPKVFIRQFSFSYYGAALSAAWALSRDEPIDPRALFGVQRVEHGSFQDPRRLP